MKSMEEYKQEIADFVLESKDYPTMQDMVDTFVTPYPLRAGLYIRAITELEKDTLMYDEKHDSWLYIKPSEKMKEWMDKAVSI